MTWGARDALREEIVARQALGWIPANTKLTARPSTLAAWTDIPEDEKAFQLRLMEVFAGFIEHADHQAGRLIDELEQLGLRDNTLAFTANDAFDVGMDSYSPVSEAYFDRKPFRFNGMIDKVQIKYLN